MTRLLALALFAPAVALAAELELGPKMTIPVPDGEWSVVARRDWTGAMEEIRPGPPFTGIYLVEVKDGRWRRAVQAMTNTEPSWKGWRAIDDPCERHDAALAYRDLSESFEDQFCYDVTEVRGHMRPGTHWRGDAQGWLADRKVLLPQTVYSVRFARIDRHFWSEVLYYFDPADCPGDTVQQKAQALMQWAARAAPLVREGLAQ